MCIFTYTWTDLRSQLRRKAGAAGDQAFEAMWGRVGTTTKSRKTPEALGFMLLLSDVKIFSLSKVPPDLRNAESEMQEHPNCLRQDPDQG